MTSLAIYNSNHTCIGTAGCFATRKKYVGLQECQTCGHYQLCIRRTCICAICFHASGQMDCHGDACSEAMETCHQRRSERLYGSFEHGAKRSPRQESQRAPTSAKLTRNEVSGPSVILEKVLRKVEAIQTRIEEVSRRLDTLDKKVETLNDTRVDLHVHDLRGKKRRKSNRREGDTSSSGGQRRRRSSRSSSGNQTPKRDDDVDYGA